MKQESAEAEEGKNSARLLFSLSRLCRLSRLSRQGGKAKDKPNRRKRHAEQNYSATIEEKRPRASGEEAREGAGKVGPGNNAPRGFDPEPPQALQIRVPPLSGSLLPELGDISLVFSQ